MSINGAWLIEVVGSILLFCLVFGMCATVEVQSLSAQVVNVKAIATGLILQFGVLPMLGYLVVTRFHMNSATGLTLLVVTSSPGGSYSNWWCSMFNADLALSVAMTSISSILSTIALPINLAIYARHAFNRDDVMETVEWGALIWVLFIVIAGIGSGLIASSHFRSPTFHIRANRLGNIAGILLVTFSAIMSNASEEARVWNREWQFYCGVALPCVAGLLLANLITAALNLVQPERVTVSIECCYQNVGIATSVALSMFDGDQQAQAVAVPFYYGIVEALTLFLYCTFAWKAGWTKAPANISFWKMLSTSYEVLEAEHLKEEQGLQAQQSNYSPDDDEFCYVDHAESRAPPEMPVTSSSSCGQGEFQPTGIPKKESSYAMIV